MNELSSRSFINKAISHLIALVHTVFQIALDTTETKNKLQNKRQFRPSGQQKHRRNFFRR